ncbi:MAG: T9SS type A sorting domain-containing protein [Bacteroidetes bacterium]|nr:T9SS type A sorting domain-containing protein [Bacteroidota bacterium]
MKKNYFVILVLIFLQGTNLFAQEYEFTYDNAGNRTSRKIITLKSATTVNSQDSISSGGNNNKGKLKPKKFLTDKLGKNNIKIYPNPTKGQLKLVLNNNEVYENSSIELYSLAGKILYQKNKILSINNIDLSDKPQGTYILRLILNNKKLEWKIIKE